MPGMPSRDVEKKTEEMKQPVSADTGKEKIGSKRENKKKIPSHAEKLAQIWDEHGVNGGEAITELMHEALGRRSIQDMADGAADIMKGDPGEMMDFLRHRVQSEVHWEDGYRVYSTLFAIPLRGRAGNIRKFIESPLLQERINMLMVSSGLVDGESEIIALPMAFSPTAVALMNLDSVLMVRAALENSLEGDISSWNLLEILKKSFQDLENWNGEDAVLLCIRVRRIVDGAGDVVDYFRRHEFKPSELEKFTQAWAERAGAMSKKIPVGETVFIGMPGRLDEAVVFLNYSRTIDLLKKAMQGSGMFMDDNGTDHILMAAKNGEYLLMSIKNGQNVAGPVFVHDDQILNDLEGFLELFSDDFEQTILIDDARELPGLFMAKGTLMH
jgi:hypothetical protein